MQARLEVYRIGAIPTPCTGVLVRQLWGKERRVDRIPEILLGKGLKMKASNARVNSYHTYGVYVNAKICRESRKKYPAVFKSIGNDIGIGIWDGKKRLVYRSLTVWQLVKALKGIPK